MHEYVITAIIGLDEAVTLGSVKPLHGSHAHGIVPSQDRNSKAHTRRLVRSNFWKGRQRLNRLYRWIANVVRPKIDWFILFQSRASNNPEARFFERVIGSAPRFFHECWFVPHSLNKPRRAILTCGGTGHAVRRHAERLRYRRHHRSDARPCDERKGGLFQNRKGTSRSSPVPPPVS